VCGGEFMDLTFSAATSSRSRRLKMFLIDTLFQPFSTAKAESFGRR
jgi:hypothetical protein